MENEEVTLILEDAEERMQKSLDFLKLEMDSIRTGRANPSMLDSLKIEAYGTLMPINQLATVSVPEPRMLIIQPFDKNSLSSIEKELQKSELGLTPNNDGSVIRLSIPQMTQERRQEMVKRLKRLQEDTHVSIRNVRRDALEHLRSLEKNKEISQDDLRREQDSLQKITDSHISRADSETSRKESELMEG